MIYLKNGKYYYKEYKNGKKKRISKAEYVKKINKKGGNPDEKKEIEKIEKKRKEMRLFGTFCMEEFLPRLTGKKYVKIERPI